MPSFCQNAAFELVPHILKELVDCLLDDERRKQIECKFIMTSANGVRKFVHVKDLSHQEVLQLFVTDPENPAKNFGVTPVGVGCLPKPAFACVLCYHVPWEKFFRSEHTDDV